MRCQSNVDCPSALICNTVDDLCVECIADASCASGLCLPDNTCSACGPNKACPQGQLCAADGQCKDGCETDTSGCDLGLHCVPGSSTCVECTSDAQCGAGRVCDLVNHVCRPGCSAANPACLQGLVCDTDGGACVGCLANANCPMPQQPVCNPATKTCVGCLQNGDCHGATPVCDVPNTTCVACNVDPDCGAGKVCLGHTCTPGCSQANPACPGGQICNLGKGQCVQCNTDAECSGTTPRCDTTGNVCVACLPGATDNCPFGQYCRNDFVCERGCKRNSDCPSGVCLADHSCSACTMDGQCAAGQVCQGGTCIAQCSASNPCGGGRDCCAMHCVDRQNDKANCGGCGITCGAAQGCCQGACVNLDTSANCGMCGTTCNPGFGCCGGACQSTTTLLRCGACNVACGPDQFCDGNACHDVVFPEFCANKKVYAIYDGIPLDDGATNVLASTIAANCPMSTMIQYGPQTNPAWVDQDAGALLLGGGSTVVTAGGPVANKPVKWMERTSLTTKVYFSSNNVDTFYFRQRSDAGIVASQPVATCSSHHDLLVIELARDPSSGTLALIAYGVCVGGYGTQAAGWYYANAMLPNRAAYPDSWYVFQWDDTNMDMLPNAGDSFVAVAHGQ